MEKSIPLSMMIIIFLFPSISHAEWVVYGQHGQSCGTWLEARNKKSNSNTAQLQSWVLGFISGAGYAGINLKETDFNAALYWIDNYCKDSPLKTILDATEGLVIELAGKQE
jgi:hypothetical protein